MTFGRGAKLPCNSNNIQRKLTMTDNWPIYHTQQFQRVTVLAYA